ncbi:hypothetical protein LEP1GSC074_2661 [Leptospira noguchii str. Hook]|nr:hypothetical protein LEP1GSC072_3479 [Leptospira noguchii str. Bonito]EMS84204.1 hypothetical protein LEP1GSC074_2661 [Leptospira noguchii str. Hook]
MGFNKPKCRSYLNPSTQNIKFKFLENILHIKYYKILIL